jgi:hypothetical protein
MRKSKKKEYQPHLRRHFSFLAPPEGYTEEQWEAAKEAFLKGEHLKASEASRKAHRTMSKRKK